MAWVYLFLMFVGVVWVLWLMTRPGTYDQDGVRIKRKNRNDTMI